MEVIKWDKQSAINGVEASVVLENRADLRNSDVFLVKFGEQVQCVEIVDVWKANLRLPTETTTEQVIEEYKKYRAEQDKAAQNTISENEQLKKELADVWFEILKVQGGIN